MHLYMIFVWFLYGFSPRLHGFSAAFRGFWLPNSNSESSELALPWPAAGGARRRSRRRRMPRRRRAWRRRRRCSTRWRAASGHGNRSISHRFPCILHDFSRNVGSSSISLSHSHSILHSLSMTSTCPGVSTAEDMHRKAPAGASGAPQAAFESPRGSSAASGGGRGGR